MKVFYSVRSTVASPPCSILNRLVQVATAFQKLPFRLNYLAFSEPRMPAARHTRLIFSARVSEKKRNKVISATGAWHQLTRHFSRVASESTLKGSLRGNEIRGLTLGLPLTRWLLLIPFIFSSEFFGISPERPPVPAVTAAAHVVLLSSGANTIHPSAKHRNPLVWHFRSWM